MLRTTIVMMLLINIGIAGCVSTPPVEKDSETEHQTERDSDGGGGSGGGGGGGGGY
jgi:hypothetical protein